MAVRHPLTSVLATFLWTAITVPVLFIPVWVFRLLALPAEMGLFYGVAVIAIAGAFGGRASPFAFAAFPVAFLGGFLGYAIFMSSAFPPLNLLYAAIHATVAGLAAWAVATTKTAKVRTKVALENEEKRRCRMCGARVGPHARRCWSCRASLNRIT